MAHMYVMAHVFPESTVQGSSTRLLELEREQEGRKRVGRKDVGECRAHAGSSSRIGRVTTDVSRVIDQ